MNKYAGSTNRIFLLMMPNWWWWSWLLSFSRFTVQTTLLVLGANSLFTLVHSPIFFPSLNISTWSWGRQSFWCALLTAQIIAIHHLFIFSFTKGGHFHYCILISCRGYRRPDLTSVVLSLLPHTPPTSYYNANTHMAPKVLKPKVLCTMGSCSLPVSINHSFILHCCVISFKWAMHIHSIVKIVSFFTLLHILQPL